LEVVIGQGLQFIFIYLPIETCSGCIVVQGSVVLSYLLCVECSSLLKILLLVLVVIDWRLLIGPVGLRLVDYIYVLRTEVDQVAEDCFDLNELSSASVRIVD